MNKQLKDLPRDIYALFDPDTPHEVNEENLELFADTMKELLRNRLKEREKNTDLRFSMLGQPDRKIWKNVHGPDPEPMSSKTYFKFLYGDVIEALILFLAREAGHTVEMEQAEVEVDGVKGHIDAVIDGVVTDVKSASPYSFKKFKYNDILNDDPFGYVQQLSGYAQVLTPNKAAAWLAFDKVHGDICVTNLSASIIDADEYDVQSRITHVRELLASDEPPPHCYTPVPDGKSGNEKLQVGCSYCGHKNSCWPELRTFMYSGAPRHLTKVVNEPRVQEVGVDQVSE